MSDLCRKTTEDLCRQITKELCGENTEDLRRHTKVCVSKLLKI